jgi:hypothetical protein
VPRRNVDCAGAPSIENDIPPQEGTVLNSHDLAILGMLASAGLFVSNIVFLTLWIRAREASLRTRSRGDRVEAASAPALEQQERHERLEVAVDAIAIEVERIAEGQRFVTRLLAEKATPQPVQRPAERVITPH